MCEQGPCSRYQTSRSPDWEYTSAAIRSFGARGFRVYAGSEAFLLQSLREGGAGCISATANVNPQSIAALAKNFGNMTPQAADKAQEALLLTRGIFGQYPMIAAMKTAVAHFSGGKPQC